MRNRVRLIATAIAALALITCQPALAMTLGLTKRDSGRTLYLRKGDVVQVTLAENQSTPYRWAFTTHPSRSVLRLTKSVYIPSPAPAGVVGRGGHQVFKFKAVGSGTTALKLVLRYIANPKKVASTFSLQVRPG
jgi:inhibitor of cysteine peptidase